MDEKEKIVEFEKWCPKCLYEDYEEGIDPCWDCLAYGYTLNGKPREFKKDKKKEART